MSEEPIVAAEREGEEDDEQQQQSEEKSTTMSRKEKRKEMKKKKRKEKRREFAEKEREEEVARLNDPEELKKMELLEEEERLRMERERIEFEKRERIWLEKIRKEDEEEEERRRKKALEDSDDIKADDNEEGSDWEYVEEGPAEIIWKGNEIIVKKKKVRVPKTKVDQHLIMKDVDRPTSNPLPPQSEAFTDYNNASKVSAPEVYENVALQVPNFGTEQDKSHCPFHIKTGACRFGQRCKRVHFYPDKSCTLLIKNMYSGPGLAWEQDEGLEYTDEEVECSYEEFYEDVHTEFLKFGEIVNFKVCRNGSFHLRGNVYVHFKSLESAMLAYQYINGRFFAGKQLTCEYVGVTKWKIAICGEYMRSRLKTCSRGTACNFIHCFRNPGGDYEWADWDKPPPRYWVKNMTSLFGYTDDSVMENESRGRLRSFGQISPADESRYRSRRSKSRETDGIRSGSGRRLHEKNDERGSTFNKNHRSEVRAEKKREHGTDTNDHYLHKREVQDSDRYDGQVKKRARRHNSVLESKDDYGDSRSRETDSAEYVSDFDMERDTSHGRTRESSRHGSRTREADSDEYVSDTDMKRAHGRTKESSRHRSGAREADSDEYVSDTDMKRGHGRTKESSRHRSRAREAHSDEYVSDIDMKRNTHHGRTTESSRHRSRAREAHSDEYVSDTDMKRDTRHGRTSESSRHRSRALEAHSDEYVPDIDMKRDTPQSSRHRNKENRDHRRKMSTDSNSGRRNRSHENEELSKLSDDYGDKKNMNAESDTERDISEGRLKETRRGRTRKSTRHSHRDSSDQNGGCVTRKRDHDTDSGGEWTDREKSSKKYHHRKRKSSTHRNDHRETKKKD